MTNDKGIASNPETREISLKIQYIEPEPPLAFFSFDQTPLKEVIEDLPDGYYEVDLKGNLTAFNRALCRIHGYSPEEMAHMNYRDYTPPELHDVILKTYLEVYNTGRPVQVFDFRVTRPDSSTCIIHTSIHLIRNKQGKPVGFRGISRDVTDEKRTEAYEKARTRVLESIARNAPLEETLEAILLSLQAQMPDFGGLFFHETDGCLKCMARVNIPESFVSLVDGETIGPDGKIFARVAFYKEPIIIQCVETDSQCSQYREELMENGLLAIWAYPVISSAGRLIGVLAAYPGTERKPLESERQWLQSAAATAEIAIEHHRMTSKLSYLSRYDPLTGILNRRSFMNEAMRLFSLANRKKWTVGLLFLDLDNFKQVNDTWGHKIGDLLLTEVTRRLSDCLRESDCLGIMGGDEFAVFVPETTYDSVQIIANRILTAISRAFDLNGVMVNAGVSIGIAAAPSASEACIETLLTQADEAMYHAKKNGLGWAFHKPEQQRAARCKADMESMLRSCMADGQLPVYYQPVLDLKSNQCVGVEALLRWSHPERGILTASEFLPLAEARGLSCDIDRYVLPRAIEQTRLWHGWVSVNVSPHSLYRSDWTAFVRKTLEANDFPFNRLIFEITESILLEMERVVEVLEELCRMGVRIALDDFGKGYSSLFHLAKLSVHCLKIDQSFIRNLNCGSRNATLVEMLIALSSNLEVTTIAEGLETKEDMDWLMKNGCAQAQGFFLGHPAPWENLAL